MCESASMRLAKRHEGNRKILKGWSELATRKLAMNRKQPMIRVDHNTFRACRQSPNT